MLGDHLAWSSFRQSSEGNRCETFYGACPKMIGASLAMTSQPLNMVGPLVSQHARSPAPTIALRQQAPVAALPSCAQLLAEYFASIDEGVATNPDGPPTLCCMMVDTVSEAV